jgi:hypothetical protein
MTVGLFSPLKLRETYGRVSAGSETHAEQVREKNTRRGIFLISPQKVLKCSILSSNMSDTFETYVDELESLVQKTLSSVGTNFHDKSILTALDGSSRAALNSSISLEERRKRGLFFTSSLLAKEALRGVINQVDNSTVFLDPACGAGDLLLSCVKLLPVEDDLELTLHKWGERIAGLDLRPEFVRAARVRLFLAALSRCKFSGLKTPSYSDRWFPLLSAGNFFENLNNLQSASMIVINPPYQLIKAPEDCSWASGKVSNAALFMDYCVSNSSPNSRILAILPDVLRSGSRYSKWRDFIAKNSNIEEVTLLDRFDQWTDIHVFILKLQVTKTPKNSANRWSEKSSNLQNNIIGNGFEIHVGAVVPHRDKKLGKSYPYLVARNLPAWKTVTKFSEKRRFSGTVYNPPFVVVRRTSRPEDKYRAVGTIISGKNPIAVENHLLVLQPKDNSLKSCRKLLGNLQRQETSDWLNNKIRCRHLTVSSLSELPWWSDSK